MLGTNRLLIRPFLPEDVDAIYALVYADQEVRQPLSNYKGTLEEFRERFGADKLYMGSGRDSFHYNALVRKEDGVLLGLMGFQNHADENMDWLLMPDGSRNVGHIPGVIDVELTYALGRKYWGQGYATEAGKALIEYGFSHLGIHRIINAISPDNFRSRNLMLRLSFAFLDNGNPDDTVGLLANPAFLAAAG